MFKASAIIRNARLDKELSFEEIAAKTKIPVKYLQAFEADNPQAFPDEPYCSLLIKDYAEYLGLDGQKILGLFRRDFAQKRKTNSPVSPQIVFTPKFTFMILISIMIVSFSSYLIFEYLKFNRAPNLKVAWPDSSQITTNVVEVKGVTDPESTIRINQDLVIVDDAGNFQKKVNIASPESKIVIESRSPSGKTTIQEKTFVSPQDNL